MINIVTDSTCDLPAELTKALPITVVPLYVTLNGKSYLDSKELDRNEFFKLLPNVHPYPTTAAPSPAQFLETYDRLADQGATAIFSIHIAGSLSAIFSSAQVAAEQYSRIPVYAVDSGNLSMALGLIVLRAATAAESGANEAEIESIIKNAIPNAYAYAKLDTIDFLLKGGRITAIQHSVIGMLGIKPILKMNNYISKMEMARTKQKAFERVVTVAKEIAPTAVFFGITHANAMDQLEKLMMQLRESYPAMAEPLVNEVNPALGSHVGPGALCINWLERDNAKVIKQKGTRKWF